jgi:excisionase family DNA binding protein
MEEKKIIELLTTEDVAKRLKVKATTVRKLALEGKIPRIKLGGKLNRFLESDIEAYILSNREA